MNLFETGHFSSCLPESLREDFLIKQIVLTHDPDGRRFDSELLLRAVENIMYYATTSEVYEQPLETTRESSINILEVIGSTEPLEHIISEISCKMLFKCPGEGNLHTRTMLLFDLLRNYKWDAKLVIVLAAFATSYGKVCLIMQLHRQHPLALSMAMLKQLPNKLNSLKPHFKALNLLVKTMGKITRSIIKFEDLAVWHLNLDFKALSLTKSQIYKAAYWVIRSVIACTVQVTDLTVMKHEQVHVLSLQPAHSTSMTTSVWELSSLTYRLSSIFSCLKQQVDGCHQEIETKIRQKLSNLFKESHTNNLEVLQMLFALKDELPLKGSSAQAKIGVSELENKVVILLISKPKLVPMERLLFLVQQIYDHPYKKELNGSYEIVWVPIPSSHKWTDDEESSFDFLSNSLPWYSIRQPWSLSPAIVNYIREIWNFEDDPIMVVLDTQGNVANTNAIDMALIWGPRAYPFSSSRERELWDGEKWTLQLMVNETDSLLTKWVEEGKKFCFYGSESLDWIREFNANMKHITSAGVQVEVVYVGANNKREQVRKNLATIDEEKLSRSLSINNTYFFWLRLESIRRSKHRLGKTVETDHILNEVEALLDFDDSNEGWAVIGTGSSADTITLQGSKLMEFFNLFSVWGENVGKLGLSNAVRAASLPAEPCSHSRVVAYAEGLVEGTVVCEKCKRPMEKFVVFKCDAVE